MQYLNKIKRYIPRRGFVIALVPLLAALLFIPSVKDSAQSQTVTCSGAPTQATLNPYPVSFAEPHEACHDLPFFVGKPTNGSYPTNSAAISAGFDLPVGAEAYLRVYVHNGPATGGPVAQNVTVTTSVDTSAGTTHTVSASATSSNTNSLSGSFPIRTPAGAHLEVVAGSGELYDLNNFNLLASGFNLGNNTYSLGNMPACFEFARILRFKVRVVGPSYEYPTPSYVYPTPSYTYPTPSYSYPTPSYSYPTPSYSYPTPSYSYPTPSYSYPTPSYSYPTPSYSYPTPSYSYPTPSYSYPTPSYSYPTPSYYYPTPSYYYPTPSYTYPTPATPNIVQHKVARDETKNGTDSLQFTADREDFIIYTLTVQNSGQGQSTNYVITDDLSGVLPFADMVDNGGGQLNGNTITYPAVTLNAGQTISKSFKVRVKFHLAAEQSYILRNTYGDTVTITVPGKTVFVAPKTGAGGMAAMTLAGLVTGGFALFRGRKQLLGLILK